MQKADKGPLVHSRLCDMYLFTSVLARSRYSVSLFIVFRGGFASVRPHSRADHSLGQEPVYAALTQCAHLCARFTRAGTVCAWTENAESGNDS